jgi:transcriptional regulator with XRE-family HTH domain
MQIVHRYTEEIPGLGKAIIAARKAKNLSQQELGDQVGVSHAMIGYFEREEKAISLSLLRQIEQVLNVELINFKIDE